MQLRPLRLPVVALTVLAAVISVSGAAAAAAAAAAAKPTADQPVSRFVAFQTCQAKTWEWTALNAKDGTEVGKFRHQYRPQDVWREDGGWHVQVAGKRGVPVKAYNDVAYCLITGTNAHPENTGGAYPR